MRTAKDRVEDIKADMQKTEDKYLKTHNDKYKNAYVYLAGLLKEKEAELKISG